MKIYNYDVDTELFDMYVRSKLVVIANPFDQKNGRKQSEIYSLILKSIGLTSKYEDMEIWNFRHALEAEAHASIENDPRFFDDRKGWVEP